MNRDPRPPNLMILASAGSGKTHALVTRFVQLAALGVAPERIGALTFTRKSAGEFLDRILGRLMRASTEEAAARALAAEVGVPAWGMAEFSILLERMVQAVPRLALATLDSFFVRLLHSFSLEFGLGGDFVVSDAYQQAIDFDGVCRRMFETNELLSVEQENFIESFDLATFGQEERSLLGRLRAFVETLHAAWLQDPDEERWGTLALIWPEEWWFQPEGSIDVAAEAHRLSEATALLGLTPGRAKKLTEFAEAVVVWRAGSKPGAPIVYIQQQCLADADQLRALLSGQMTLEMLKGKVEIGPAVCRPLLALLGHVMAQEMRLLARRTRGQWRVLAAYEKLYEDHVRRRGRLTFEDVKFVLAGGGRLGGPRVSLEAAETGRLHIDYRLDGIFDHWLLDEFQDTSLLQWRVIERAVDDIFDDPDRGRTYFQVGDVKQSIYRWRGGEPRLSRYLLERYGPRLLSESRAKSYRSAPAILNTVNRVFGDEVTMREIFPAGAVDRWEWQDHEAAHVERTGFAALVRPQVNAGVKPEEADRLEVVARLLRELRPLERGLTCAILFRGNDDVLAATARLRAQPGLPPIASESDAVPALDNPVTLAALSLLQLAAHPGDSLAWQHVNMTPVAAWMDGQEWRTGDVVREVLSAVAREGFAPVLARWLVDWRNQVGGWDAFSDLRVRDLLTLARRFDEGGSRNVDEFLRFVSGATVREASSAQSVQVMTIHKAKGLEFDVVFLPKLGGMSFTSERSPLLRHRPRLDAASWLLARPRAEFVAADPVLGHVRDEDVAATCHESCCTLYVAMTRAVRALYLVGEEQEDSTAATGANWIERSLACGAPRELTADGETFALGFSTGEVRWYAGVVAPKAAPVEPAPRFVPPACPATVRHPRRTPSGSESHLLGAAQVFALQAAPARDRGILVHALFEHVVDPADMTAMNSWWVAQGYAPEEWQREAFEMVGHVLKEPAVREVMGRPGPQTQIWPERRFEIILDGEWITGTIDRVVVGDSSARVVDFKTDLLAPGDGAALESKVSGYQPQLDLYRRVVSRLTGLPEGAVQATLIFTAVRAVVRV